MTEPQQPDPDTGPVVITPADLAPYAEISEDKANSMITAVLARAALKAPCITRADFAYPQAAKAVLMEAILRWHDAGNGARTQTVIGPFQGMVDTTVTRRGLFTPTELEELEEMCREDTDSRGGAYDTAGHTRHRGNHADVCSLNLGAHYCSCGADIAGKPLWEKTCD